MIGWRMSHAVTVAAAAVAVGLAAAAVSGTFTATGSMVFETTHGTAALLNDGQVLVLGGSTPQLYNPATGTWAATGRENMPRIDATATLLPTGNVLVAGGLVGLDQSPQTTAGAMLYNPATNTWAATGAMTTGREGQTATLLPDGLVLMADGTLYDHPTTTHPGIFEVLSSAELYTPQARRVTRSGGRAIYQCDA